MRAAVSVCLLLSACGPVLLFGDEEPSHTPTQMQSSDAGALKSVTAGSAGMPAVSAGSATDAATQPAPRALISVKPVDCARCFDLVASGNSGVAPYRFEWDNGSQSAQRHVCANQTTVDVSVIVEDANGVRSAAAVAQLQAADDASCPPPPEPPATLCISNPSFEGAPAANLGLPQTFDAAPWSTCTNPAAANTPDIGSDVGAAAGTVPKPTDGNTFVALAPSEQVSQKLCQAVNANSVRSLRLDIARVDLNATATPVPVYLEIWAGTAGDCSLQQRLWKSPALVTGFQHFCAKIQPAALMDQITLRANNDNMAMATSYVLVDNLVPVDDCP